MALRAEASADKVTTSGGSANGAKEYWFPRPLGSNASDKDGDDRPLVIIGGARETAEPTFEMYIADDATVNPVIGEALRRFLPTMFPGRHAPGREPEMEWVRCLYYSRHKGALYRCGLLTNVVTDRYHGLHEGGNSVCTPSVIRVPVELVLTSYAFAGWARARSRNWEP